VKTLPVFVLAVFRLASPSAHRPTGFAHTPAQGPDILTGWPKGPGRAGRKGIAVPAASLAGHRVAHWYPCDRCSRAGAAGVGGSGHFQYTTTRRENQPLKGGETRPPAPRDAPRPPPRPPAAFARHPYTNPRQGKKNSCRGFFPRSSFSDDPPEVTGKTHVGGRPIGDTPLLWGSWRGPPRLIGPAPSTLRHLALLRRLPPVNDGVRTAGGGRVPTP